jgi:hypothetical protein
MTRKPPAMQHVGRSAGQGTNTLVSRMTSAWQNGPSLMKIQWKHDAIRKLAHLLTDTQRSLKGSKRFTEGS